MEGEGRFKYKAPRDQMGHAGGCEINFWWRFLAARSRFGLCPLVGVALCPGPGVRQSELSVSQAQDPLASKVLAPAHPPTPDTCMRSCPPCPMPVCLVDSTLT